MSVIERILAGDVRSAARLIRDIEDGMPGADEALKGLYAGTGRARIIGVTGSPGSGKSTICDNLIRSYRSEGVRVGCVAVDPSSPYSGGAILGDRIRMQEHSTDPGVFIRSMATRGNMGGLSAATGDVIKVMDAMGCGVVIVETVGVGQDEIDIARMAHATVVVLIPGMGDDIQAIKAGLLEIADVFVVNKCDRDGAERVMREIIAMLEQRGAMEWTPPVVRMVAIRNEGMAELRSALASYWEFAAGEGRAEGLALQRRKMEFVDVLGGRLRNAVDRIVSQSPGGLEGAVAGMIRNGEDPYSAADRILAEASALFAAKK